MARTEEERRRGRGAARPSAESLARYREVAGDWEAFCRSLAEPLPACAAANTLRVDALALGRILAEEGVRPEPVLWHPGAFLLPGVERPGLPWEHRVGLYHVLEEASLMPVALLAPLPGERVLDLCAAPGGKTAQVALAMGNRGVLVANDKDVRRLAALRDLTKRLGLVNVTTTALDGRHFPLRAGPFDRVLVDAPCSGEGGARRRSCAGMGGDSRERLAARQISLLRRAARLCRPGGRIVYSTCTLAPEEDEAVVDAVLREFGAGLCVVPVGLPGLPSSPGLVEWEGARFREDLRNSLRLWPHVSGTGGFFAAALEKGERGEERPPPGEEATGTCIGLTPPERFEELLAERFGFPPGTFAGITFFRKGPLVHAVAADHAVPPGLAPESVGLPFCYPGRALPKLTTAAALAFGGRATRNVVEVDAGGAARFLNREPVPLDGAEQVECAGRGYVIARYRGFALGLGILRPETDTLESLFPKTWAGG